MYLRLVYTLIESSLRPSSSLRRNLSLVHKRHVHFVVFTNIDCLIHHFLLVDISGVAVHYYWWFLVVARGMVRRGVS